MRKLAKRLVSPDLVCPDYWSGPDYVLTDGPAVAELNAAAGFAPDPQQELGLDLIFAVGTNGLPASFAFCVICARQNLKTGLLKQAAIGWMYVTQERRVVWSAHEMDTTREAQGEIADLITETPALSKLLPRTANAGIYDANDQRRIELSTGQVLKFKARTLTGGRGLSGDKTILDEAFALKAAHVGSLLPTMTARPHGQVLYASSAGKADSVVLRDVRDRGRAGTSPRLYYLEWGGAWRPCEQVDCLHPKSGAVGCALDDEALWRQNNPTVTTGRISIQTIADLRQELPPEEFARESMVRWDEAATDIDSLFGPGRWDACAVEFEELPEVAVIGLAVSYDEEFGSIGAVSFAADERPHLDAVDRQAYSRDWMVSEAQRIQEELGCAVALDEKCPDSGLIGALQDAGVELTILTLDDVLEACSELRTRVREVRLTHMNTTELDDAVGRANWRSVGDGRKVLGRRQSSGDVSMLEANAVALGAALKKANDVWEVWT